MADSVPHLECEITKETLQEGIAKVIEILRPDWQIEEITTKENSTGYVNTNFALIHSSEKDGLFLRIVVDIVPHQLERCKNAMKYLKRRGLGAELLLTFKNGVVMEYLEGEVVTWDDTDRLKEPEVWAAIARETARYHINTNWEEIKEFGVTDMEEHFGNLGEMVLKPLYGKLSEEQKRGLPDPDEFQAAITKVLDILKMYGIKKCFCHSDANPTNLLIRGNEVVFVDYDDCAIDYPAWEIARFFGTFCGPNHNDFSKLPLEKEEKEFIREYLRFRSAEDPTFGPVTEKLVDFWLFIVRKCDLLVWATWSLSNWFFDEIASNKREVDPNVGRKFWQKYLDNYEKIISETYDG